ncbi:MAG TPA: diaminopimelate epimerase [Gemmatimonadaceae bacterium]|nr:diaminopimelate epimerase [Gemmatimonadaceae bacterium]
MDGLAASIVGPAEKGVTSAGRSFYKMSGSGNDFVFFDIDAEPAGDLETPEAIQAICARGTGVGADGLVFFSRPQDDVVDIRYYNSDGSSGELCGNATLCSVRLAKILGSSADSFTIHTDAGDVDARLVDGLPEIDLEGVVDVTPDFSPIPPAGSEQRLGYAMVGVPHVVIEVPDVSAVDIVGRGREVRTHRSLAMGANVNFVARDTGDGKEWSIRTYERGVEGETLACGTGAVAAAVLLTAWGRASEPVGLVTKSGRTLSVRLRKVGAGWNPSLRGAADLVFTGRLEPVR